MMSSNRSPPCTDTHYRAAIDIPFRKPKAPSVQARHIPRLLLCVSHQMARGGDAEQ